MGRASGLAKVIAKFTSKGADDAVKLSAKVGANLTKATTKALGAAKRLAAGGAAAAGAYLGNKFANANDNASSGVDASFDNITIPNVDQVIEDSTINIPDITASLNGIITQDLLPVNRVEKQIDFTTTKDTPIKGITVDPVSIVENYFEDNYSPVTINNAVIPADTKFEGMSKSLGVLQSSLDNVGRRLRRVEVAVRSLEDTIEEAIAVNESTNRANERRRDERNTERARGQSGGVSNQLGQMAGVAGAVTGGFLGKYLLPGLLLAGAAASDVVADETANDEETLGEKLAFLDDIEQKYVSLAAAFKGAQLSGITAKAAAQGTNIATKVTSAVTKAKDAAKATKAGQLAVKAQQKISQTGQAIASTYNKVIANPKAQKILKALTKAKGILTSFGNGFNAIFDPIKKAVGFLPKFILKAFKGLLAKPIRWYVAFEAIFLLIPAAEAYMLGTISEDDFHTQAKEAINRCVGLIGGSWIVSLILGLALGTAGTVVPIIGNIGGAALGILIGMFFGENIYRMIGGEVIVNAIYDYFVYDKITSLNQLGTQIKNAFLKEWDDLLQSPREVVTDMFEAVFGMPEIENEQVAKDREYTGLNLGKVDSVKSAGENLTELGQKSVTRIKEANNIGELEQVFDLIELHDKEGAFNNYDKSLILAMGRSKKQDLIAALDDKVSAQTSEQQTYTAGEIAQLYEQGNQVVAIPALDSDGNVIPGKYVIDNTNITNSVASNTTNNTSQVNSATTVINKIENVNVESPKKLVALNNVNEEHIMAMSEIRELTDQGYNVSYVQATDNDGDTIPGEYLVTNIERPLPNLTTPSSIQKKSTQVIPLVVPINKRSSVQRDAAAGTTVASSADSATPSYQTSDSFIDYGLQT